MYMRKKFQKVAVVMEYSDRTGRIFVKFHIGISREIIPHFSILLKNLTKITIIPTSFYYL
jgi:hypothetical protein